MIYRIVRYYLSVWRIEKKKRPSPAPLRGDLKRKPTLSFSLLLASQTPHIGGIFTVWFVFLVCLELLINQGKPWEGGCFSSVKGTEQRRRQPREIWHPGNQLRVLWAGLVALTCCSTCSNVGQTYRSCRPLSLRIRNVVRTWDKIQVNRFTLLWQ